MVKLDKKINEDTYKEKSKNKAKKIKIKIEEKIKKTKTELRKLQALYSAPEKLPDEIKIQVAKKIKKKKNDLKKLYSDPQSVISLEKSQRWAVVQVVKAFLGIPIIPGK